MSTVNCMTHLIIFYEYMLFSHHIERTFQLYFASYQFCNN
ncbi:hypothetical protein BPJM79_20431 [Bacillus pumilus]